MKVVFRQKQLGKCYEDFEVAARKWGPEVGRKYIQRVKVLLATEKFGDLYRVKSLDLHPLKGTRKGRCAITVHDRWRMELTQLDEKAIRIEEVNKHYGD